MIGGLGHLISFKTDVIKVTGVRAQKRLHFTRNQHFKTKQKARNHGLSLQKYKN